MAQMFELWAKRGSYNLKEMFGNRAGCAVPRWQAGTAHRLAQGPKA